MFRFSLSLFLCVVLLALAACGKSAAPSHAWSLSQSDFDAFQTNFSLKQRARQCDSRHPAFNWCPFVVSTSDKWTPASAAEVRIGFGFDTRKRRCDESPDDCWEQHRKTFALYMIRVDSSSAQWSEILLTGLSEAQRLTLAASVLSVLHFGRNDRRISLPASIIAQLEGNLKPSTATHRVVRVDKAGQRDTLVLLAKAEPKKEGKEKGKERFFIGQFPKLAWQPQGKGDVGLIAAPKDIASWLKMLELVRDVAPERRLQALTNECQDLPMCLSHCHRALHVQAPLFGEPKRPSKSKLDLSCLLSMADTISATARDRGVHLKRFAERLRNPPKPAPESESKRSSRLAPPPSDDPGEDEEEGEEGAFGDPAEDPGYE